MTDIERHAADPMAYFADYRIPSAHGPARYGDVWEPHQETGFRDVAPTLLAISQGKKPPIGRFWIERTKGASKDTDIAAMLSWLLAHSSRKLDCQVGGVDRDNANELKKAFDEGLRLNPHLAQRIRSQGWSLKCDATGSECVIVAADIAGSHGARPDVVVLNELSHMTKETFAQNLLDNASKKPRGLVIVATNAGFENTWQHRLREMARESGRWHFQAFSQPAPWLGDDELGEAERRNSRSRFARLYWGEWVSGTGDALDPDDIRAAVVPGMRPGKQRPLADWFYLAGLDLGIKHDHSALVVIAGNRVTLELRLAHAQSWKPNKATGKVNLMEVERAVAEAHKQFELTCVGYDPHQAALMAQRLEVGGAPMKEVTFTGANLNTMASTLLDVFRSRRLAMYDHPALLADLGRLTIEEKSYGHRLSATKTDAGHADLATALAIALPLAVDAVGDMPVVAGVFPEFEHDDGLSAEQRQAKHWRQRLHEYQMETDWLKNLPDPNDFERFMRRNYPGRVYFGGH